MEIILSRNIIKSLESELEKTRIALRKHVETLNQIEEWLESECEQNEDADEKSDNPFDLIHFGRKECAEALLNQIHIWEKAKK
jgi:hypothetical protein